MDQQVVAIRRAVISVFDKTGIAEFASRLVSSGTEILSTGGTHKALVSEGIAVTSIDSYTGFPEMMDGRVKTLHPRVHGGLLCVRDNAAHMDQMMANGISLIDLVVVNLYPFQQTVSRPGVTIDEAVENIDIGGPAMLRSAAKNHRFVAVLVDPADYAAVLSDISAFGGTTFETRKRLAVKAYRTTAGYDGAIDAYLSRAYLNEK